MVQNYMESIVDLLLPAIVKEYKDICKCERCLEDIKAITLNHLKPVYIATEKGYVYSKIVELEVQFRADVIQEIVKAIITVSRNPRHDL